MTKLIFSIMCFFSFTGTSMAMTVPNPQKPDLNSPKIIDDSSDMESQLGKYYGKVGRVEFINPAAIARDLAKINWQFHLLAGAYGYASFAVISHFALGIPFTVHNQLVYAASSYGVYGFIALLTQINPPKKGSEE